jgi:hypothetical protein
MVLPKRMSHARGTVNPNAGMNPEAEIKRNKTIINCMLNTLVLGFRFTHTHTNNGLPG